MPKIFAILNGQDVGKKEQPRIWRGNGHIWWRRNIELVGLYLLDQLSNLLPVESFGLYRDDGRAILSGISGPDIERIERTSETYLKPTISK